MSVNVQTKNGLKQIADKTTKKNILKVLGYTPANKESLENHRGDAIIHISSKERDYWDNKPETYEQLKEKPSIYEDLPETLYVVDKNSNIIAFVDNEGIHTTALEVQISKDKKQDIITFINDSILDLYYDISEKIITDYNKLKNIPVLNEENDDTLYISDSLGNVSARFDKNGLTTLNVYSEELFEGKKSLSSKYAFKEEIIKDYNKLENKLPISEVQGKEFKIVDSNNNIIFRVDNMGVHVTDVYAQDIKIEDLKYKNSISDIYIKQEATLSIADIDDLLK